MKEIIHYLLIEDRKNIWEDFNYILDVEFSDLKAHKRNRYIESFTDMENNLYEAIIEGELDLIISDISLTLDTKNKETFISQLLINVFKRLTPSQKKTINRKGMGLILVTQFPEDNLATIIGEDILFLNQFFQDWSFIKNEDFETKIADKINEFTTNFEHTSNGWYHNDRLDDYAHQNSKEITFYLKNKPTIRVRGKNIIAITTTLLYYFNQNDEQQEEVQIVAHEKELTDFMKETKTTFILDGRDMDNHFYDDAIIYFLPIRNRKNRIPEIIINTTHPWRSKGLNRGRLLTLNSNKTIQFNCSFPILNKFIDKHYPKLNR